MHSTTRPQTLEGSTYVLHPHQTVESLRAPGNPQNKSLPACCQEASGRFTQYQRTPKATDNGPHKNLQHQAQRPGTHYAGGTKEPSYVTRALLSTCTRGSEIWQPEWIHATPEARRPRHHQNSYQKFKDEEPTC